VNPPLPSSPLSGCKNVRDSSPSSEKSKA
jgi:hypothetical protein